MTSDPSQERLEEAAQLCELSNSMVRLIAGEMGRSELRAVQAMLKSRAAAIRELSRRPAPSSPAGGWRTIDSAPKDGTRIIAYAPKSNMKKPTTRITWWRQASDNAGYIGWGEFNEQYWPPTHWQPLPPPPDAHT